jgi:hypothetical protein
MHKILQERTLAFLNKNVQGHGFIYGRDGTYIDRIDLRLNIRVKHRIYDLDELRARIDYAEVPVGRLKKSLGKIGGIVPGRDLECYHETSSGCFRRKLVIKDLKSQPELVCILLNNHYYYHLT